MINAAIIGLGWWGKTLVEAVARSRPSAAPPTAAFGDGAAAEAIGGLLEQLSQR